MRRIASILTLAVVFTACVSTVEATTANSTTTVEATTTVVETTKEPTTIEPTEEPFTPACGRIEDVPQRAQAASIGCAGNIAGVKDSGGTARKEGVGRRRRGWGRERVGEERVGEGKGNECKRESVCVYERERD